MQAELEVDGQKVTIIAPMFRPLTEREKKQMELDRINNSYCPGCGRKSMNCICGMED